MSSHIYCICCYLFLLSLTRLLVSILYVYVALNLSFSLFQTFKYFHYILWWWGGCSVCVVWGGGWDPRSCSTASEALMTLF